MSNILEINNENIKFKNSSDVAKVTLTADPDNTGTPITLILPTSLPTGTDDKFLVSDTNGSLSFSAGGGGGSITGTFSALSDGGTGISSGNSINTAFGSLDTWIFKNLVNTPPAPTNLAFNTSTTTSITVTWTKPTVYQLGILDTTVPFITSLVMKVYKSSSVANLSASFNITKTADSTAVSATGAAFSGVSVGDSITIPGGSDETRVVLAKADSANITVDSNFANTNTTAGDNCTHITYSGSVDTTTVTATNNLPREGSSAVIEALIYFIDGGSNGSITTVASSKSAYNRVDSISAANTDKIKVEVYYSNHNGNNDTQIAYLAGLEFLQPGVPGPPSNLTFPSDGVTTLNVDWDAPSDNDTNIGGNQTTPAIDQYKIRYMSTNLNPAHGRYGGAVSHSPSDTTSSSTDKSLSNLHALQIYSVYVSAKNTINAGYSTEISASHVMGDLPSKPNQLTSSSLTRESALYTNSTGRLVENTTSKSPILNRNSISGSTLDYNNITNIRCNTNASDVITAGLVQFKSNLQIEGGAAADDAISASFPAFPTSFSETANGTNSSLVIANHEDKHNGDTYQANFYSQIDMTLKVNKSYTVASGNQYTVKAIRTEIGESNETITDTFYVDDLNTAPTVPGIQDLAISGSPVYISGVPSIDNNQTFNCSFTVNNLGHYFIRTDNLARIRLRHSSSDRGTTTIADNSFTSFTYTDGNTVSASPIDTTKTIQFSTQSVNYAYNSGVYTTTGSPLSLEVAATNVYQSGYGSYKAVNRFDDDGNEDGSGKYIYIDSSSEYVIDNYLDGGSSGSTYRPSLVLLSTNNASYMSSITSSSNIITYDHEEIIVGNSGDTHYNSALQLVNGYFRTRYSSDYYLNYGSTFRVNTGGSLISLPDYSSVASDSSYRYTTFKYSIASVGAGYSRLIITLINSSGFSSTTGESDIEFFVKTFENTGGSIVYSNTASNDTSIWLNANAPFGGGSINRTVYSTGSNEPFSAVELSGSSGTVKRIYLPAGSGTNGLTVLVRIGIKMSANKYFKYMTLSYA